MIVMILDINANVYIDLWGNPISIRLAIKALLITRSVIILNSIPSPIWNLIIQMIIEITF